MLFRSEYSLSVFERLESKYGTYYAMGNHELYAKDEYSDFLKGLDESNVRILLDQAVFVQESFYIVGRLDYSVKYGGIIRKTNEELVEGLDASYPIIVMNHQPEGLEEASKAGVDLMLSGHTHDGQLYPGNILVAAFSEFSYGWKKTGELNTIVSSGYGTWGFHARVGSKCEMVKIILREKKDENR